MMLKNKELAKCRSRTAARLRDSKKRGVRAARRAALLTGALVCAAAISGPLHAQQLHVRIAQGEVAGKSLGQDGALYAGLPFAAPPIGDLRWKAPAPPASWSGVRDATLPGPTCPQPDLGWNHWDASHSGEDCLSLNIWVPRGSAANRPVMVWFHGGGFIGGSGSAPIYNGTALTREGVIVVTVNYRLGVLGFLAHPELAAESPNHVSGNYGVMDQVAALAWVHRNIARFGGDPGNVTIFGQSAGSMSASILVTLPEARRYFRRAIFESGTPFGIGNLPTRSDAERGDAVFGHIADLRKLSAKEIIDLWNRYATSATLDRRAIPIVDGMLIKRQPMAAYRAGVAREVPLLVGSNAREIPPASREALAAAAKDMLGSDAASVIASYERRGTDPVLGDPGTQMMTDMMFRCGSIMTAGSSGSSWLYHFMENFPGRPASAHSAEVFYVFDSSAVAGTGIPAPDASQATLASIIRDYWTNFAKKGDPNGAGLPSWPRYAVGDQHYVTLAANGVHMGSHLREEECRPFIERWSRPKGPEGH